MTVVAESVIAWELASAIIDQFGADRIQLIQENVKKHEEYAKQF